MQWGNETDIKHTSSPVIKMEACNQASDGRGKSYLWNEWSFWSFHEHINMFDWTFHLLLNWVFSTNTSVQCETVWTQTCEAFPTKVCNAFLLLLYCKVPKKPRLSPTLCFPRARNHSWLGKDGLVNTQICHYAVIISMPTLTSTPISNVQSTSLPTHCEKHVCCALINPTNAFWLDVLLIQQLARKRMR